MFARNSMPLLELHRERATLEDVFLELTQGDPAKAQPEAADGKEGDA